MQLFILRFNMQLEGERKRDHQKHMRRAFRRKVSFSLSIRHSVHLFTHIIYCKEACGVCQTDAHI